MVIFEIWSSFAYFRKPFTTNSGLTYNFIPRSTIEGLIAAILGIDRKDRYSKLAIARIGLCILSEIRKIPFSTIHIHSDFWITMNNYINSEPITKKSFHARVNLELLINPRYRIYFSHPETHYNKLLETKLSNHECVYTPYLGTSTMIANFQYIDTVNFYTHEPNNDPIELTTIIPYRINFPEVLIEKDKFYAIEQNIPSQINEKRELISSFSSIYNPKGGTIKAKNIKFQSFVYNRHYQGRKENFVFI